MAVEWKHNRYFQIHECEVGGTLQAKTFTGTAAEAYAEFNFPSVWDTNSPTKTYTKTDGNTTLIVSYEFDSASDETGWVNAVNTAYANGTAFPTGDEWKMQDVGKFIAHIKTEWYKNPGVIESTQTNIITKSDWGV